MLAVDIEDELQDKYQPKVNTVLSNFVTENDYIDDEEERMAKLKLLLRICGFESDDPVLPDSYVYDLYNRPENKNYGWNWMW